MIMAETFEVKLVALRNILNTRLRYIFRWNAVDAVVRDNEIFITWFDKDVGDVFERVVYPVKMIDSAIKTQKRKLLRDIPDCEKEVYKDVLC